WPAGQGPFLRAGLDPSGPGPYGARALSPESNPPVRNPARRPWDRFGASPAEWQDWRWQQRHALRSEAQLAAHLALVPEERAGLRLGARTLRVGATPYYLSLADPDHPYCPVRMQIVPRAAEVEQHPGELRDPLGEDRHRPVRALVHKYP